jgi:hypothetical protein
MWELSRVQWLYPGTLATWEAEIGRVAVLGQPLAKSSGVPISTNSWVYWHAMWQPAMWVTTNRRIAVQVGTSIK